MVATCKVLCSGMVFCLNILLYHAWGRCFRPWTSWFYTSETYFFYPVIRSFLGNTFWLASVFFWKISLSKNSSLEIAGSFMHRPAFNNFLTYRYLLFCNYHDGNEYPEFLGFPEISGHFYLLFICLSCKLNIEPFIGNCQVAGAWELF